MILQANILLKIIKKNYKWFIIFLFIIFLYFIFLTVRPFVIATSVKDLFPVIGYPSFDNDYIAMILYLYQYVFLMYITYTFFMIDFEHSFDNLILRIDSKTWLLQKMFVITLFIVVFKIIQFIFAYIYFYNTIAFSFEYLFSVIMLSLLIANIVILNLNFSKKNKIIALVVEMIMFFFIFKYFQIIILIPLIIIICLYNFIFFNFKKVISSNIG